MDSDDPNLTTLSTDVTEFNISYSSMENYCKGSISTPLIVDREDD